jgi:DNA-binding transcriptional ArsR family regulator
MSSTPNPTIQSSLDADAVLNAVGHSLRWRILKELSSGELRTIGELAAAAGCQYDNTIRHLKILRKAGLVTQERGKLYQIPKQYLPAPGQGVVDYGHCLLRLGAAAG